MWEKDTKKEEEVQAETEVEAGQERT